MEGNASEAQRKQFSYYASFPCKTGMACHDSGRSIGICAHHMALMESFGGKDGVPPAWNGFTAGMRWSRRRRTLSRARRRKAIDVWNSPVGTMKSTARPGTAICCSLAAPSCSGTSDMSRVGKRSFCRTAQARRFPTVTGLTRTRPICTIASAPGAGSTP